MSGRKLVCAFVTGLAVLCALCDRVTACTCATGPSPACQDFWTKPTPTVFVGKVESLVVVRRGVDRDFPTGEFNRAIVMHRVVFAVDEAFRGVPGKSVVVYTAASSAECGYPFSVGERYLVYAYSGGNTDKLLTGLCTSTVPAREASDDIAYLRSIPSLPPTARIYGSVRKSVLPPLASSSSQTSDGSLDVIPLSGRIVRVRGVDGAHEATVDASGKWEVGGLTAGPYAVEVALAPRELLEPPFYGTHVEVASKGCAKLDLRVLPDSHIRGHLKYDVDIPAQSVSAIVLFRADSKVIDLARPQFSALFEEDSFEFLWIPPGKYFLGFIVTRGGVGDVEDAVVFFPGVLKPDEATIVELGDGEVKDGIDFAIKALHFTRRTKLMENKLQVHSR